MCPLLFGLGIELDKTFGSKWLTNHLSRLGLCISNDEVLRCLNAENIDNEGENVTFMQWVTDNVDHNIVTLTGKGTFHGMGIISITYPHSRYNQQTVARLKHGKKTSEAIKNKGIELHHFLGSSSNGLINLKLKLIHQLMHPHPLPKEVSYNITGLDSCRVSQICQL